MSLNREKIISIGAQIGICVLGLVAIIVTNSVSYAQNSVGSTDYIEDEIAPASENVSNVNWTIIGNKVYCLDANNNKYTGIQYLDNEYRYFLADGSLFVGWTTIAGRTFYFDPNNFGAMQKGECYINGLKYQFLPTGDFITGWYEAEGKKYYKNEFGYDVYGIVSVNGRKYYISENGLQVGVFEVDHLYYTDSVGSILTGNCVADGKNMHFTDNGLYIYGWLKQEGKFTYTDLNGTRYASGKFTIDGVDYYFDNEGYLVVNQVIGMYMADKDGKLTRMPITINNLNAALDEILAVTGYDIKTIGEYVRTHHSYKYMDKLASREEMAVYALNNRYMSCYYYEALTGLLLERAGYEVITVKGVGFVYAEHYWSLVKTVRNGIEGYYHVDSLKAKYIRTDAEMVANGFKWTHSNYPATP